MTNFKKIEMRKVYAQTIEKLYEKDKNVYALEADLSSSMSTSKLKQTMGKNYVDLGIMEANMIGVASGINLAGGYAFAHSFGQFITRRAMDQVFISLGYAQLSACLVGSDAGVTAEHNGGTHMTFEDVSTFRVIPNMKIYDTCDPVQFEYLLTKAYENKELTYIRTARKEPEAYIYEVTETFESGAKVLKEGKDVTIIAAGIEVNEALKAHALLKKIGIDAQIIDAFRIKPLNEDIILSSAKKTGKIVTCENHSVINGLGSAVAELLSEKYPVKMKRVGIQNRYGQVGKLEYLKKEYQISCDNIVSNVKDLLKSN
ncbi:transketolase family protein [Criibacterium bergeronii]|uniref:Transketolase family protein n=1 Tax=Criibacterium bergeronii TaxID=1871336 RepID=A0A552V6G7_9FIRM|nr:transketolase C-terminal domain-containing protein [Criibacterium bergeronii]MBS6063868.1 transketolase family protein [Peptostreptococcaceae bacterium]TRW26041.1 transketolase family protein [Criibacterium bergeronii]